MVVHGLLRRARLRGQLGGPQAVGAGRREHREVGRDEAGVPGEGEVALDALADHAVEPAHQRSEKRRFC